MTERRIQNRWSLNPVGVGLAHHEAEGEIKRDIGVME